MAGAAYLRPANRWAPVAELADAHGSGPCSERSGGSTPLGRTISPAEGRSGAPARLWRMPCIPSGHVLAPLAGVPRDRLWDVGKLALVSRPRRAARPAG